MDGINLVSLKRIRDQKGGVYHALKASEDSYRGFGEAYFSEVNHGCIKGWKKHNLMFLNLIVVSGVIKFVVYNGCEFWETTLSPDNYQRLSISPGLWVAFKGLGQNNLLLNVADIEHDPNEAVNLPLDEIQYDWV